MEKNTKDKYEDLINVYSRYRTIHVYYDNPIAKINKKELSKKKDDKQFIDKYHKELKRKITGDIYIYEHHARKLREHLANFNKNI